MKAIPSYPRFSGGFKTFRVKEFSDHNKGTYGGLHVFSQGSRDKVEEYLWLKFCWDELTTLEYRLLILLPGISNSEIKFAFFRALLILPKKILRNRLIKFQTLLGMKASTRERYLGFKSSLDVEIYEFQRRLPKVPKYSGYVKSPSSVGSKSQGGPRLLEPLTPTEDILINKEIIDWYNLLTVGEMEFFSGEFRFRPDES